VPLKLRLTVCCKKCSLLHGNPYQTHKEHCYTVNTIVQQIENEIHMIALLIMFMKYMIFYSDKAINSSMEINFMVSGAMVMEGEVSLPGGP